VSERMIPLKIADMAVAACNEEIAKLQAENARLKAECQARQAENSVLAVECDSLNAEVDQLVHKVNYWRIVAETNNTRFLRCLEDKDRLTKAGDLLAFHYISLGRKFFPNDPLPSSFTDWKAAKEGKQS
jgi:c-di-GMP-binding flagellar brake protein YcgR